MRFAFLGLSASGKTTLFNALTGAHAQVGAYSGVGAELHIGRIEVADGRLDVVVAGHASELGRVAALLGELVAERLGRPLEPFDLWYNGFRAGGAYPQARLDALTRERYPTPAAYEADIPRQLVELGTWRGGRIGTDGRGRMT